MSSVKNQNWLGPPSSLHTLTQERVQNSTSILFALLSFTRDHIREEWSRRGSKNKWKSGVSKSGLSTQTAFTSSRRRHPVNMFITVRPNCLHCLLRTPKCKNHVAALYIRLCCKKNPSVAYEHVHENAHSS